jgi:DNA-binding transcriptional MerR regulator/methylmalonyl-CoA mutase cobalamin-binding subunit
MIDPDNSDRIEESDVTNEQLWPMGAVTRRTGIGEHTLRAWERRFGFPTPHRLPSGHRRYSGDQVRQLLLINEALSCGYRAGDVVALSREKLEALLAESDRGASTDQEISPEWLEQVFTATRAFDREDLMAQLRQAAAGLGVGRFLRDRVEPMLAEVGQAWERGDVEIRHEHFASQVLEDVLRSLRLPLESVARGRPVMLATLPEEFHGLGLQIAALMIASAGRSVRIVGPHTPVDEIVQSALELDAAAVGLSISEYSLNDETSVAVTDVRRQLPSEIRMWLGGAGAKGLAGLPVSVTVFDSLEELERAVRSLAD